MIRKQILIQIYTSFCIKKSKSSDFGQERRKSEVARLTDVSRAGKSEARILQTSIFGLLTSDFCLLRTYPSSSEPPSAYEVLFPLLRNHGFHWAA